MSLFRNIGFLSLRNSLLMEIMISSLFILSSGNVESTIWINSFNLVPCWIVNPFSSKCILSWRIKRVTFYLSHFHGRMQRISRLSESLATPQLLSKEWISLLYIFFMFLNSCRIYVCTQSNTITVFFPAAMKLLETTLN